MTYSPELIALVREHYGVDHEATKMAESSDVSLVPFLHDSRPSIETVTMAESIIEQGAPDGIKGIARSVLRRLRMSDMCNQEYLSAQKAGVSESSFISALKKKYPGAKITRK